MSDDLLELKIMAAVALVGGGVIGVAMLLTGAAGSVGWVALGFAALDTLTAAGFLTWAHLDGKHDQPAR